MRDLNGGGRARHIEIDTDDIARNSTNIESSEVPTPQARYQFGARLNGESHLGVLDERKEEEDDED